MTYGILGQTLYNPMIITLNKKVFVISWELSVLFIEKPRQTSTNIPAIYSNTMTIIESAWKKYFFIANYSQSFWKNYLYHLIFICFIVMLQIFQTRNDHFHWISQSILVFHIPVRFNWKQIFSRKILILMNGIFNSHCNKSWITDGQPSSLLSSR